MSKKIEIKPGITLEYDESIICEKVSEDKILIKIGFNEKHIVSAACNMQEKCACFESLVFIIWSISEKYKIELEFERLKWSRDIKKLNEKDYTNSSDMQNYLRFLYRAWKLEKLFPNRFTISHNNENKYEVDLFAEQYNDCLMGGYLWISPPDRKSSITTSANIIENHLEKWFVVNIKKDFDKVKEVIIEPNNKDFPNIELHDQLPCGVFCRDKSDKNHSKNCVLSQGAFDLWGLDKENGEICIFELKTEKNAEIGIISELFFYSCVLGDIFIMSKDVESIHRGFNELSKRRSDVVQAYFLVPKFDRFIEENNLIDNIIEEMNKRNDRKVKYGYYKFSQSKLVEKDFIEKIKEDWKRFIE